MRKKINKIAALFIVSIFALSGTGMAFAAWFDTITITGTVETGELQWEFTTVNLLDMFEPINFGGDFVGFDSPYADYTCYPGFVYNSDIGDYFWHLDKNVGWGDFERVDTDNDGHFDTILLWLNNTYPCYFNEFRMYLRNCGTIPLKFNNIVISDTNGNSYYINSGTPIITLDLNNNGIPDFEIWWNDNDFGDQLEPGDRSDEWSLWLHVLQDEDPAFQSGSFGFFISLTAVQWNAVERISL
jgi:hypothetical protein